MHKTTVHLSDELDQRLEAEARAAGVTKAELICLGVTKLLDESQRPRQAKPFPVFRSGRDRSVDELREDLVEQVAARAARR